jgi:hypothetical protein
MQQDALACSAAFLAQHGGRAGWWQQQRPASRSAALHPHAVTGAFDVDSRPVTTGNPKTPTSCPSMAKQTAGIRMPRDVTVSTRDGGGRILTGGARRGESVVYFGHHRGSRQTSAAAPNGSLATSATIRAPRTPAVQTPRPSGESSPTRPGSRGSSFDVPCRSPLRCRRASPRTRASSRPEGSQN